MSDFADRPFVAGSLTGVRSFKVDEYGRLTGVVYPGVWTSGETVGHCGAAYRRQADIYGVLSLAYLPASVRSSLMEKSSKERPDHRVGSVGCGCGFYAYFDTDANPHHEKGQTVGLVEGSGLATVGTRGFRCEKARIVALIDGPIAEDNRSWWTATTLLARTWLGLSVLEVALGVTFKVLEGWAAAVPALIFAVLLLAAVVFGRNHSKLRRPLPGGGMSVVPDAVRRNYPDVPVYPSLTAALAEHPLTPPPLPSPESDPDFWTRGAVL